MSTIIEIKGNIFESSCQTLVNTVNCEGYMGKGIALEFKNRYPGMYASYKESCDQKTLRPGQLLLYKESIPWILNFPTKDYWKLPSKIEYIEFGLTKFTSTYKEKGIASIAFPQLGSAHGGLNWGDVKKLMYKHLAELANLDIEIYQFDPNAKDSFFEKLYQKIHRFEIEDYKRYLNLGPKPASILKSCVQSKSIHSMLELQNIDGIGEKTLEKIYAYVQSGLETKQVIASSARQQNLF